MDNVGELVSSYLPSRLNDAEDLLISEVEEAAKRWEEQQKQGHRVVPSLLADRDGNNLQRFANDIKDALQTLKVDDCFSLPT